MPHHRLTRSALAVPAFALIFSLLSNSAFAQLPELRLYAVSPPGAQHGTEVEVKVTSGEDLDELEGIVFNHPGITAKPKMQDVAGMQKPVPQTYLVTVAGDVPPGSYEVRAKGLYGLSNPRTFFIGHRPEVQETEPNNGQEQAQEVALNSTVNGLSNGGADLDYFKFQAKKGERIIATLQATRIDSRLEGVIEVLDDSGRRIDVGTYEFRGDPVADVEIPADGTYFLKIYDFVFGGGNDFFYRLSVHTEPHVDFVFPPAGKPGTTGEFTLYGRNLPGGQPTEQTVDGHPLQALKVQIALPNKPTQIESPEPLRPYAASLDGFSYFLNANGQRSNPVFIQFTDQQVVAETEPNTQLKESQAITVPVDVAGQFQQIGDEDHYVFEAKKGETYFVEVFGQRLGTSVDPYFVISQIVVDPAGNETAKQLTAQDDNATNIAANLFDTVSDDPVFKFTVPEDARYRITVRDRYFESRGGAKLVYLLSVRKPAPDFRLVVLPFNPEGGKGNGPSAVLVRRGSNVGVQVLAYRRDEFNGPIEVSVEGLPQGVTCPPVIIGEGENSTTLICSTQEDTPLWQGDIQVIGKAKVDLGNGMQDLVRQARGGTIVWAPGQQNLPPEARVSQSVGLAVLAETLPFQITTETQRVQATQGSQILIPVKIAKRDGFDENVALNFQGFPKNSNVQLPNKPTFEKGKPNEMLVRLFVNNNAAVGSYTVYLQADGQISYSRNPERVERAKAEQMMVDELLKKSQEEAKQAVEARNAANQKVSTLTNEMNAANQAKQNADKQLADAQPQLKQAQEAVAKAEETVKAAADDNAKKQAEEQLNAAKQKADEAQKKVTELEAAAKAAAEKQAKAQADLETAQAEQKTAEANVKTTDDKVKQVTQMKQQADKEVNDATNAAKPKNIKVTPPSTPIVISVRKAPATIAAQVPNGGNLKKGEQMEVKVTVKREGEFKGPVNVTLPLPPGIQGLTAQPLTIAPDQTEGVLLVKAEGNAPEGAIENLVVRGEMDEQGPAAVDAPIQLKITN